MKKTLLIALALMLGFSLSAQNKCKDNGNVCRKGDDAVAVIKSSSKAGPEWHMIHTPFSTTDVNGNPVNVADTLAAGKCIVIDYSCTWCGPCFNLHNSKNLEAIYNQLGDQVCVLWVESDGSTPVSDIYGASSTSYGDWTHYSDGTPVLYPIIDCEQCESMIDPTGYVPAVYFVAPNGYYCHIYGESWGIGISMSSSVAVSNIQTLINSYPRAGVVPSVTLKGPNSVIAGNQVNYSLEVISVDPITSYSWTATDGTPATGSSASFSTIWNTAGTKTVSVTVANTTGSTTESMTVDVVECETVNSLDEGFESGLGCWSTLDEDGDGYTWGLYSDLGFSSNLAHSGSDAMASASFINNIGVLTPDNWLISPQINVPSNGATLEWWSGAIDASYHNDYYSVLVSTNGTDPTNFTGQLFAGPNESGNYTQHSKSLSAYAGQQIHIAFRHYNCTDVYWLLIDDVKLTAGAVGVDVVNDVKTNVYPNPTDGKVYVSAEDFVSVEVLDMNGRVVKTSNEKSVDMSNFANGVYMFRILTANGTTNLKVVKK